VTPQNTSGLEDKTGVKGRRGPSNPAFSEKPGFYVVLRNMLHRDPARKPPIFEERTRVEGRRGPSNPAFSEKPGFWSGNMISNMLLL
jgi:hypothetical protein